MVKVAQGDNGKGVEVSLKKKLAQAVNAAERNSVYILTKGVSILGSILKGE